MKTKITPRDLFFLLGIVLVFHVIVWKKFGQFNDVMLAVRDDQFEVYDDNNHPQSEYGMGSEWIE